MRGHRTRVTDAAQRADVRKTRNGSSNAASVKVEPAMSEEMRVLRARACGEVMAADLRCRAASPNAIGDRARRPRYLYAGDYGESVRGVSQSGWRARAPSAPAGPGRG